MLTQIFGFLLLNLPIEQGAVETVIYATIGIVMAVISFKVIDWITPGNLSKQIAEENNTALALLVGFFILGICIIIAQAIG